jgi:two-component system chemotaxis response regulator CheY
MLCPISADKTQQKNAHLGATGGGKTMHIKILLIEHIPAMQRTIKHLLAQVGYNRVSNARDSQQALMMLRQGTFNLILADWEIPPQGGLALLQAIRSDAEFQKLPVLAMLNEVNRDHVTAALQAGVTNLLVKPFNAAVLQEKISAIFPHKSTPDKDTSAVPQALFARDR